MLGFLDHLIGSVPTSVILPKYSFHDKTVACALMMIRVQLAHTPVPALGIPVWTLLKADSDSRWMEDRSDSPWYPMMRLYRQSKAGEWGPMIKEVVSDLRTTLDLPAYGFPLRKASGFPG